jgi:4-hydroxy-2-oxoheptanedioate aldolase
MLVNHTKARLRAGETVYGCFVRYPDAGLAELLALQPFDFLVFDGEHGTLEPRDGEHLARAAELHATTPLVRVPANVPPTILRFLDGGAQGVHVPLVSSVEDAEAAVRAVKYAPRGARGLAGVRAAQYGQRAPLAEYVEQANEQTLVVLQVETRAGVARAGEIAAVDGVDVVFVGPTDLSQALGVTGDTAHPLALEAYDAVAAAVSGSEAALGVLVSGESEARAWRERGARYIAFTVDGLVVRSARALFAALQEEPVAAVVQREGGSDAH